MRLHLEHPIPGIAAMSIVQNLMTCITVIDDPVAFAASATIFGPIVTRSMIEIVLRHIGRDNISREEFAFGILQCTSFACSGYADHTGKEEFSLASEFEDYERWEHELPLILDETPDDAYGRIIIVFEVMFPSISISTLELYFNEDALSLWSIFLWFIIDLPIVLGQALVKRCCTRTRSERPSVDDYRTWMADQTYEFSTVRVVDN